MCFQAVSCGCYVKWYLCNLNMKRVLQDYKVKKKYLFVAHYGIDESHIRRHLSWCTVMNNLPLSIDTTRGNYLTGFFAFLWLSAEKEIEELGQHQNVIYLFLSGQVYGKGTCHIPWITCFYLHIFKHFPHFSLFKFDSLSIVKCL